MSKLTLMLLLELWLVLKSCFVVVIVVILITRHTQGNRPRMSCINLDSELAE